MRERNRVCLSTHSHSSPLCLLLGRIWKPRATEGRRACMNKKKVGARYWSRPTKYFYDATHIKCNSNLMAGKPFHSLPLSFRICMRMASLRTHASRRNALSRGGGGSEREEDGCIADCVQTRLHTFKLRVAVGKTW